MVTAAKVVVTAAEKVTKAEVGSGESGRWAVGSGRCVGVREGAWQCVAVAVAVCPDSPPRY